MATKIVKPAVPPTGHAGAPENGVFLVIRVFCPELEIQLHYSPSRRVAMERSHCTKSTFLKTEGLA